MERPYPCMGTVNSPSTTKAAVPAVLQDYRQWPNAKQVDGVNRGFASQVPILRPDTLQIRE